MIKTLKNYPGNKSIEGLYQWIINRIPPHKKYYELFAGSAQIARRLPDTAAKVLVDCDPHIAKLLEKELGNEMTVINSYAENWLTMLPLRACKDTFVYMDPPYMIDCIPSGKKLYRHSMSDIDHEQILAVASKVKYNCMISHPSCEIYNDMLKGWTKEHKIVRYHTRTAKEWIYYNYPKPQVLHTYKYVGNDCWDRQRIKRKIERLTNKLIELPALERNAVISRVTKELSTFQAVSLK
jgi:site-specific DNA-adenine methylase